MLGYGTAFPSHAMSIELSQGRRLVWNWDDFLHGDVSPRIIAVADNREICVLIGHTDYVRAAFELADGRLLTWSNDTTLRVWRMHDGACEVVFRGHRASVYNAMEIQPGVVLSWDGENTIQMWRALDGMVLGSLVEPDGKDLDHTQRDDIRGVLIASPQRLVVLREKSASLVDLTDLAIVARYDASARRADADCLGFEYFLLRTDDWIAVHALSDGREVEGFELRGYPSRILVLRSGRILAMHWSAASKRHVVDLCQPLPAKLLHTVYLEGEDVESFCEEDSGEVLVALQDYRRFRISTQPLEVLGEMPLQAVDSGGIASFTPQAARQCVIGGLGEQSPTLRAEWLSPAEVDAFELTARTEISGVSAADGRQLLRLGDAFQLFDPYDRSLETLSTGALHAVDRELFCRYLDSACLEISSDQFAPRMQHYLGVDAALVATALEALQRAQRLDIRRCFVPAPGGAIFAWREDPPAAWWLDASEDRARVEVIALQDEQRSFSWFAHAPLVSPTGVVHVLRDDTLEALACPGRRTPVTVLPAFRERITWARWCAGDRIAANQGDGVTLFERSSMKVLGRLPAGHGIGNRGIIELTDGTLLTWGRATLRSWHAADLSPRVELRDPAEWGPGCETVQPLACGVAFCVGQYAYDRRVIFWDGEVRLLVSGTHTNEVVALRDLGNGWIASLGQARTWTDSRWRIWRIPQEFRAERSVGAFDQRGK